ncbi:fibronectin type III domain protein [Opisthorchis viverrini]|uniref:Fibronectin type III domain protein n=1 Tax=Opisthorchis viverrini TaxID=6198 RepID=A0A1S8X8B6_OPIVI|nr:fibronectin type III domain protein [Opisthorchis viverrini]
MCFRDFGVLFKVFSTNTFISPSQLAPQIELKVNVETNPPRITWSIDADLGIEAFQIIVWDKPDSEEIIPVGSVTSLELTDLAKCIEYTVQVMAVKEGLPLLEICSAPVSFTILEGVYTPKLTVENTAPDEVHASWTEPTSCQASDYIYKLSVTHAGSEPRTITKLFPTTDLESPTHLRLLAMNASHLTLSWIESAVWDICGTVKHVVTVVPLDGDPPTIVTVDGTSATVSVNECSWYEIYVHMETADSMFRSARSNGIVLQSPLRPYGVPDFEIVNLNPGIQKISWNGGVEWTSECVRKYDVTISPVKSLGKEFKFTMLSGDPGAITGELLPCTEYQYTVSSGSESKTKILKTLPSSFLPTDVTAVINSPNALKVNWGAPRCVESIGDVHYSVTIRPSNEGSETMKQEVAKDSLTQGAVEFQVKPCTAYLVYMEADTMGLKDRSKLIMVKDGNIEKPKVTVTNIEPGVQKVSWTDPIAAPECRHLFEVQQTNVFTGGQVTITVSATERIFVELTHCTNYEYTVRVVGEHVSGQKSDPVRLVTISPKPETPTLIEVTVEGPTSVKLTWSTPIPHDHCSHTGYIVTAQAANDPSIRATTDLQYKTLTVKTCTSYLVAVQAQYSDGSLSEKSQFRAVTTPAYEYVVLSLKPRTINSYRLRIIGLPGNVVGPYSVATSKRTTGKGIFGTHLT